MLTSACAVFPHPFGHAAFVGWILNAARSGASNVLISDGVEAFRCLLDWLDKGLSFVEVLGEPLLEVEGAPEIPVGPGVAILNA